MLFDKEYRRQLGMIKCNFQLLLIVLLLVGCSPATPMPPASPAATIAPSLTPTVTQISTSAPTPSPSRVPTQTKTPTLVPTATSLPTATITPPAVVSSPLHPQALNVSKAGQMKLLVRLGQGELNDVQWSPDGKYLAAATGLGVHLYDAITYEPVRLIETESNATQIAFNPDGTALAIARDSRVGIWEVETGRKRVEMQSEILGGVWTLAFGDEYVAACGQIYPGLGDSVAQFKVWQAAFGREVVSTGDDIVAGWTYAIDISPNGKTVAYTGEDGFGLYDLGTGQKFQSLKGNFDVVFSPDGSNVFSTAWDWYDSGKNFSVNMLDLASGATTQILEQTQCQYLARSGNFAICYGADSVIVFDPVSGVQQKAFPISNENDHPYSGDTRAAIHPDGSRLAVVLEDRIQVLDVKTGQELKGLAFDRFEAIASGVIVVDGSEHYVAATESGSGLISIWDLATGSLLRKFQANQECIRDLTFSPDQATLATTGCDGVLRLWNVQRWAETNSFSFPYWNLQGPIAFRPDGAKLAIVSQDGGSTLELDLQSGELQYKRGARFGMPYPYVYNASTGHLMSWEQDMESLILINYTTGEEVKLPHLFETDTVSMIEAIALSPDGKYLAGGQAGGQLFIWDLQGQKLLRTLAGHTVPPADGPSSAIHHLAFNPQGDLLLSVGYDGTVRLWNVPAGRQLQKLNSCCYAEFSSDGRLLITAGQGVIRVYGVPPWP